MSGFVILMAFLLFFPFMVERMEKRIKIVRWLSPIIICYMAGIVLGNIPGLVLERQILVTVTGISVFLAIPLLLFSADFQEMLKQVKPALLAFILGISAVLIMSVISFLLLRNEIHDAASISGMMIGVYTGGTANMNAIGLALGVEEEVFILLNSADIIFSGIYFIFLMTFGKWILGFILPRGKHKWNSHNEGAMNHAGMGRIKSMVYKFIGLLLALCVLLLAILVSMLIMNNWTLDRAVPVIILGITSLGIAASFIKKIRTLPHNYSSANYLLLVFALAMGAMANFNELRAASSKLFLFCGLMVFGSIVIQYLLASLLRVDRDTAIIASTASIFGPAFIGPVAKVLNNRDIIGVGIALGLLGYAMGNYLGIGISYLLN